jgi:hypothetical protein
VRNNYFRHNEVGYTTAGLDDGNSDPFWEPDFVTLEHNTFELGCTNDLGQLLFTERICSCQSDDGSSASSFGLRPCSW